MANVTSAALVVASLALGFYLIRWGVRGLQRIAATLKEIK
jgi:hypothetical protein